jgi:hypothetical protein
VAAPPPPKPEPLDPARLAAIQANQAESARLLHESYERQARNRRNAWITRIVISAVIIFSGAFLRYQFRKDMASVNRNQEPTFVFDPYLEQVRDYASQMCFCQDLACARNVESQFEHWSRASTEAPTEQAVIDRVTTEIERMAECQGKLEAK